MSEFTQVLHKRLEDIDRTISTLTSERLFLDDLLKRYRLERIGADDQLLYEEIERRGLRAAGRTREIFELCILTKRKVTPAELGRILNDPKVKKIRNILNQLCKNGYFEKDKSEYFISDRGITLYERSAPYTGRPLDAAKALMCKKEADRRAA